jgi:hypothetical protein
MAVAAVMTTSAAVKAASVWCVPPSIEVKVNRIGQPSHAGRLFLLRFDLSQIAQSNE